VHAAAPDADREKVMLLEPSFRSKAFYDAVRISSKRKCRDTNQLLGCQP
jgi:hypothetical protein